MGQNLSPFKATVQQIAEFFLYLHRELKMSIPAVKGHCAVLTHVFSLAGVDLAANHIISRLVRSFENPVFLMSSATGLESLFSSAKSYSSAL